MRSLVALLSCAALLSAAPDVGYRTGNVHPDFELPTLDGKSGKLSDYRGRKVFLFNFASW